MDPHEKTARRSRYGFLLIFIVLATGIVACGFFFYGNYKRHFRAEIARQLSAIADLKTDELVGWRAERLADATVFFRNASFSGLVRRFFEKPADSTARSQLWVWLSRVQKAYDYDRVFLLDADALERLSAPDIPEPVAPHLAAQVPDVIRSGQVTFLDFHRDAPGLPIHLSILVPVLDDGNHPRTLGVLVLKVDPEKYLYPFIVRWPTASRTAETLIVRREGEDVVFLNELRFQKRTSLNLRLPLTGTRMPAVRAALGYEGIMDGIDYRGVPVVAALRAVPDSPWFLVARMDSAEVYAPVRERLLAMVLVLGALIASAGMGVGLIRRHERSRFYRERYEASEALRESEELFRSLYENSTIGLYRTTPDGRVILANPALVKMLGYSSFDDLSGRDLQAEGFAPSYPRDQFIELIEKEGTVRGLEAAWKRRDGITIFVRESARAIRGPEGQIVYFDGTVEDITSRKEAEEEIRRKNASLEAISDTFKGALACETSEEVGRLCLHLAQKLTGSKMGFIGEVNAAGGFDTIALSDPGWVNCKIPNSDAVVMIKNMEIRGIWGRVITAGKSLVVNEPSSHPDRVGLPEGHPPITTFLGVPLEHAGGTIGMISLANKESGYSSIDREMVESVSGAFVEALMLKRSEEAQRRAEENFRRSLDDSPLGVRIVTAEGDTLYANKAILDLYGFDSLEELNKTPLKDRYTPQSYGAYKSRKIQRQKGDFLAEYEISIVRKNGEARVLQVFRKEVLWNGGKQFQVLYRDITERKRAEERLHETLQRLHQAVTSTIQVLGMTVEARDPYTAGHQQKTTLLAEAIAGEMGLPPEKIEGLHMAGEVHDIGKISIPSEILSKPTGLTTSEFNLVKTHPKRGYEILKNVEFPWPLAEIVYQHHERMDGSGYPRGLKGEDILMEARILAVADTVEAMASDRPYRPAPGIEAALAEVEKNKGVSYDADAVATCLMLFRKKGFRFPA